MSGRFVNAYSKSDWVLAFVHRSSALKYDVAGLSGTPELGESYPELLEHSKDLLVPSSILSAISIGSSSDETDPAILVSKMSRKLYFENLNTDPRGVTAKIGAQILTAVRTRVMDMAPDALSDKVIDPSDTSSIFRSCMRSRPLIENIDVSGIVSSHLEYRERLFAIMALIDHAGEAAAADALVGDGTQVQV